MNSKLQTNIFTAVFLFIIYLPSSAWLLGEIYGIKGQSVSVSEKRLKAQYPKDVSLLTQPKEFAERFNIFHRDNLPFRDFVLRFNTRLQYILFSKIAFPGVVLGSENWLFYASSEIISAYRPPDDSWDKKTAVWRRIVERKNNLLRDKAKIYALVAAPNKHSIYPEYLPSGLFRRTAPTRFDLFSKSFAGSGLPVFDPRELLREAKKNMQLYYKTDTHWTDQGASLVVERILRHFYGDLAVINQLEFPVKSYSGDLAIMAAADSWLEEKAGFLDSKWICSNKFKVETDRFKGGAELAYHRFDCNSGDRIVLVFGDSFAWAFSKVLAPQTKSLFLAKARPSYYEFNYLVDKLDPDLVIEVYAERNLEKLPIKGMPLRPYRD